MERLLGNPVFGATSLVAGVGQTFIETAMPIVQLFGAFLGVILVSITISIKWEERKKFKGK
jgi:hypothetical protein